MQIKSTYMRQLYHKQRMKKSITSQRQDLHNTLNASGCGWHHICRMALCGPEDEHLPMIHPVSS